MRLSRLAAWGGACLAVVAPSDAADLTVASWGGAYEAAQRAALIDPYEAATGLDVDLVTYAGTAEAVATRAAAEGWDVVDMLADQALAACAAGTLLGLSPDALLGQAAMADFAPVKPGACAIPQNVYARVMAYDDGAYPGVKPTRIQDFFDTTAFPGKRAVQKSPDGLLEWALLAEGVPPAQVYDLLSTDRGLGLAFRRLDAIRDHIVWWEDPAEPVRLLRSGEAAMAAGFNGRFFTAAEAGAPISIVWDGRLIGTEVWAIPATTDAPDAARDFVAFAVEPAQMARLSERIPYGPARRSAFPRIGLNPETGTPMRAHLPNAPQHGPRALVRDSRWYANTESLRQRRFRAWLEAGDPAE
ncbi:MAG: extracellular solute-binding protein [Deinococcus-Thermus bacterium]|jgi:putative spermidine/putrescine transport system substrate-binding protein|nr:extracellular solute-binding protein [Deinococcota bacterium]